MKWNEVKIETASEAVEAVANILMEAGASGVAIEDTLDIFGTGRIVRISLIEVFDFFL